MDSVSSKVGVRMIKFNFEGNDILPRIMPKKYPELLRYEGKFTIKIENRIFFYESDFPIFEFILFVDDWIKNDREKMLYNSMELDDNPLISFYKKDEGWIIESKWQLFVCKISFKRKDLEREIELLKQSMGY